MGFIIIGNKAMGRMTNNNKLAQVTGENFALYEMWELIMKMNRAKENARKEKRKKLKEKEIGKWKIKGKKKTVKMSGEAKGMDFL